MYLRISRARFDPARYEELLPLTREIAAAIQQLPGCQSYHLGIDRNAGTGVSASTWDTEEHARFSPDSLGNATSRLQALGVQVDPPEIYEIPT